MAYICLLDKTNKVIAKEQFFGDTLPRNPYSVKQEERVVVIFDESDCAVIEQTGDTFITNLYKEVEEPVLDEEGNQLYEQLVGDDGNPVYEYMEVNSETNVDVETEEQQLEYDYTKPVYDLTKPLVTLVEQFVGYKVETIESDDQVRINELEVQNKVAQETIDALVLKVMQLELGGIL